MLKWTKEECLKDSKKYRTRRKWADASKSAYNSAQRNGWLKECCQHMLILKGKWTKDTCLNESKKYKNRKEWSLKSGSSYNAARKNDWITIKRQR